MNLIDTMNTIDLMNLMNLIDLMVRVCIYFFEPSQTVCLESLM